MFIDKYTQVPRILKPIAQAVDRLSSLVDDAAFHEYVSAEWGSIHGLTMQILSDFFKHGFDGSGVYMRVLSYMYDYVCLLFILAIYK